MCCATQGILSLTALSRLAAGNVTGFISESPEVPVGFVQNHYSFSATYTSLLKHGETLVVFAALLFISIPFHLGSYPLPTNNVT